MFCGRLLLLLIAPCLAFALTIIQKPIKFDARRIELTKEYMANHFALPASILIKPAMIVIHYTEFVTFAESYDYFNSEIIQKNRGAVAKQSPLNVSAHYLVDRDGTVYQLVPANWMARHVIGLDYMAVGIENVGGTPQTPLTSKQLQANIELVRYLKKQYPDIRYLIGHYEYGMYRNTSLWKEIDPKYFTYKQDPGFTFMVKLRNAVKDLKLIPTTTKPVSNYHAN